MYEFIKGELIGIYPTFICIDNQGVGYRIFTPNPFEWQENLHKTVTCYIELVVREDAHTLYGFLSHEERDLFITLNKVSGIGPKSALSILAGGDNQGLVEAIDNGDSQYLTKFPGVGKKTAQQMILDLGGKINLQQKNLENAPVQEKSIFDEIYDALLGLGYSQREISRIQKTLEASEIKNTQEGLSLAFKLLLKK